MRDISEEEDAVLALLARAWNTFVELPVIHPCDRAEFCQAIHVAQNIVLSRPAVEQFGNERLPGES